MIHSNLTLFVTVIYLRFSDKVEVNPMCVLLMWHFISSSEVTLRITNKTESWVYCLTLTNSGHEYMSLHLWRERHQRIMLAVFSEDWKICSQLSHSPLCHCDRCFSSWSNKNNNITVLSPWIAFTYWIVEIIHLNPPKEKWTLAFWKIRKKNKALRVSL